MMRISHATRLYVFSGFLILASACNGPERRVNRDELVSTICEGMQKAKAGEVDSLVWARLYNEHLAPQLKGLSSDSANALYDYVTIRLQRDCVPFMQMASRMSKAKYVSDWEIIAEEPESKISGDDYASFFRTGRFTYLESDGNTAGVVLTDSTWEDHLADSTYSRLSLKKLREAEFVITFIESNNRARMAMSKPGDQYRYKILEKHPNYFYMYVQPVGSKVKSVFKLYY